MLEAFVDAMLDKNLPKSRRKMSPMASGLTSPVFLLRAINRATKRSGRILSGTPFSSIELISRVIDASNLVAKSPFIGSNESFKFCGRKHDSTAADPLGNFLRQNNTVSFEIEYVCSKGLEEGSELVAFDGCLL